MRPILAALALLLLAAPARAEDSTLVCARHDMALNTGRAQITFYTGANNQRWDSGWHAINRGGQFCLRRDDVRAFNVTVQAWTLDSFGWETVCNENRRPAQSLVAEAYSSGAALRCRVQ